MAYVLTVVLGFAFGAADQYLGSRSALGAWASAVSLMSAPWMVLPFLVGSTQEQTRRAMKLGLIVTGAALAGYFVMTLSPMENVPIDRFWSGEIRLVTSGYNPLYILAGTLTGPTFAWLGHRWRVERWWVGAALVVGTFCLEPLALRVTGQLFAPPAVWVAEVTLGLIVAGLFGYSIRTARQTPPR